MNSYMIEMLFVISTPRPTRRSSGNNNSSYALPTTSPPPPPPTITPFSVPPPQIQPQSTGSIDFQMIISFHNFFLLLKSRLCSCPSLRASPKSKWECCPSTLTLMNIVKCTILINTIFQVQMVALPPIIASTPPAPGSR